MRRASNLGLIASLLAVVALLQSCSAPPAIGDVEKGGTMKDAAVRAPELDGGVGWLNTDKPLSLKDLRGKIVLLDFWTFCCINCMHVIPDLKKLEAKYPQELVVIGVHSAKFENEKETDNIRDAILRYEIEHPVVNDANFKIWSSYGVRAWPTLVVVDPDGRAVGKVSGEGNFEVLDQVVAKLIAQAEKDGKLKRSPLKLALEKDKVKTGTLKFPGKVIADATTGNLFVSDSGHNRILVTDKSGKVLETIGSGQQGHADGAYAAASFHHPQGMVLNGDQLYVADTENHLLRQVDLKSKSVRTIAGTGKQALHAAKAITTDPLHTELSSPWDLALVKDKLFIAMAGPHQIWVLDLPKNVLSVHAGSGREDIIDGPLKAAALAQPSGITTDGSKLYFVDSEVSAVREADIDSSGSVRTIIGEGLFEFGDKDGKYPGARLQHPLGILWHDGKLYIADSYNHKIKVIDPVARTATSLLGTGKPGNSDSKPGNSGESAQFAEPGGLTAIGADLFIADTNNNALRRANIGTREVKTLIAPSTR